MKKVIEPDYYSRAIVEELRKRPPSSPPGSFEEIVARSDPPEELDKLMKDCNFTHREFREMLLYGYARHKEGTVWTFSTDDSDFWKQRPDLAQRLRTWLNRGGSRGT